MSLLAQLMEECRILNKVRTRDGEGGSKYTWAEGASFMAAIGKIGSGETKVAEKPEITEAYMVVVDDSITLAYHDVIRRVRDGATFRITTRTKDSTAHPASTVRIAAVNAERWEPTT